MTSPVLRVRGRRPRFLTAVLVATLIAGVAVLAPTPSFAVESEMRTDQESPTLEAVPAADAPAPAIDSAAGPEATPAEGERLVGGAPEVDEFVLIGVAFESAASTGQVRVHTDGAWEPWMPIVPSEDHIPAAASGEPASPTVSEPIWVDRADGYQLDLPRDARGVAVYLVRESDRDLRITDGTSPAGAASGRPTIHGRAEWGARPYEGTPEIRPPLERAIVHHTVTSNNYDPGQVPAILRSVQAYHMDARGWADIGYNFLVDRFGRIWEGRQGGVANVVLGSHAGENALHSTGISYIGEASTSVTSAAVSAYGELIGWKMFIHGVRPTTSNIIGHRDVMATACPGDALWRSLGTIRSRAATKYASLAGNLTFVHRSVDVTRRYTPLTGDFNADGRDDVFWYGPGAARDYLWFATAAGFAGRDVTVNGTYLPPTGDFDDNGRDDVFWYAPGEARDVVWYGSRNGSFVGQSVTVNGVYEPVAGDWDADGRDDVLWYGPADAPDHLWSGAAGRAFVGQAVDIDGSFTPLSGDFNGDLHDDVFWYAPGADPDEVGYGQDTRGSFTTRPFTVNGTYAPFTGDFDGGGRSDVFWYGPGGASDVIWLGRGTESFSGHEIVVNGTYTGFSGDWNGDGRDDILWYAPGPATDHVWLAG